MPGYWDPHSQAGLARAVHSSTSNLTASMQQLSEAAKLNINKPCLVYV